MHKWKGGKEGGREDYRDRERGRRVSKSGKALPRI
jgi:hypothetical protein